MPTSCQRACGVGEPGVQPGLHVDVVVARPGLLDDLELTGARARGARRGSARASVARPPVRRRRPRARPAGPAGRRRRAPAQRLVRRRRARRRRAVRDPCVLVDHRRPPDRGRRTLAERPGAGTRFQSVLLVQAVTSRPAFAKTSAARSGRSATNSPSAVGERRPRVVLGRQPGGGRRPPSLARPDLGGGHQRDAERHRPPVGDGHRRGQSAAAGGPHRPGEHVVEQRSRRRRRAPARAGPRAACRG